MTEFDELDVLDNTRLALHGAATISDTENLELQIKLSIARSLLDIAYKLK